MLPLVGLIAPYGVGYALGWCIVDFHYKYSQTRKWIILLWKTIIGILCMVLCVMGFRMIANRQIAKDLDYLAGVDRAVSLMEGYADAYTAESTADRYIFILEADRELLRRQEFNKIFEYVIDTKEYKQFMAVEVVRPPISEKAWEMAMKEKPDWVSVKQLLINEVRAKQLRDR